MGNRVITDADRERVAADIAYLRERGAKAVLQRGLTYSVVFKDQKADYWPLANSYKIRMGNSSHTVLRSQNPPQRLLDHLSRLSEMRSPCKSSTPAQRSSASC